MKIGELVTLSQYGSNLEACWRYHRDWREGKVVGLLIDIYEEKTHWRTDTRYKVLWLNQKYSKLKRTHWMKPGIFRRSDLKMYKPPKEKK